MFNSVLLLAHCATIIGFALGAVRLGKEALVVWVVFQCIVANLFVLKQIDIASFHVTCSDVYAIGSIVGLNLIQEFHGKHLAKKTTWICFFFMALFAVISQLHLFYIPNAFDGTQLAYQKILEASPRLLMASLVTYLIVQQVDVHLFSLVKKRFGVAPLWMRNGISTTFSQALDTALFSILGLYGIVDSILDIMVFSYIIKILVFALLTPLSLLAHKVVTHDTV